MKGIEVNEENFEALLAYDDLFLDYFNAFLQLPAFPQPLFYNRLTGTFQEVDKKNIGFLDVNPAQYGPSDDERERIYEWAKFDRLPLFLRSNLLREYKLCKLLIQPLDERISSSHQSTSGINGYSRQTTSYATSSLENSIHRSTYENIDNTDSWPEIRQSLLGRYVRPGSRAWSLPPMIGLGKYVRPYSHSEEARPSSDDHSTLSIKKKSITTPDLNSQHRDSTSKIIFPGITQIDSNPQNGTVERLSSKLSHSSQKEIIHIPNADYISNSNAEGISQSSLISKDIKRKPEIEQEKMDKKYFQLINHEDGDNVESFVDLDDDLISEVQTEAELKDVEDRLHMTFQQLKEEALGMISGMQEFCYFLKDTIGIDMINFWLDCESYLQYGQSSNEESVKNKLFRLREIQDKYTSILTEKAKKFIKKYGIREEISDSIFLKTQYDILRRLRTYWLPRFLIHTDKNGGYRVQSRRRSQFDIKSEKRQQKISFLPALSLVKSLPVRAQSCLRLAQSYHTWDMIAKGESKRDKITKPVIMFEGQNTHHHLFVLKVQTGLAYDKAAGGPFMNYLKRHKKLLHIANLLFWQDVTDYSESEDRLADRMLCMGHAWFIFNKYITLGSNWSVGINPKERDEIHQKLLTTDNYVSSSIFNKTKEFSVHILQTEWLRYLKEDLKTFLLWRQRPDDCIIQNTDIDTPPMTKHQRAKQMEKKENHPEPAVLSNRNKINQCNVKKRK